MGMLGTYQQLLVYLTLPIVLGGALSEMINYFNAKVSRLKQCNHCAYCNGA